MQQLVAPPSPISVFIIEPQALVAKALTQVLLQDASLTSLGEAPDVESAALSRLRPDLIVLDLDGRFPDLPASIQACHREAPNAKICVLSTHLSVEVMQRALTAGADGYIVKDITPSELVSSLKTVAVGGFYADARLAGAILKKHISNGKRPLMELSPRELEVIHLIAEGKSNKEISSHLVLSDKTVKNHISHIFAKLNVSARTQVAIYAIRNGLA